VGSDNNLCEQKARILKEKINQVISLRSFEHLAYSCECLSVLDHFAADNKDTLYQSVKEVFKRKKPIKPKAKKQKHPIWIHLNRRQNKGLIRAPVVMLYFSPMKNNEFLSTSQEWGGTCVEECGMI